MTTLILAFFIGVIGGLRAMTAPAAVSWAARLGWLHLESTWLAFLGFVAFVAKVFPCVIRQSMNAPAVCG